MKLQSRLFMLFMIGSCDMLALGGSSDALAVATVATQFSPLLDHVNMF